MSPLAVADLWDESGWVDWLVENGYEDPREEEPYTAYPELEE